MSWSPARPSPCGPPRLGDGSARPFHANVTEVPDGGVLDGLPEPGADSGLIMLSDPYSFPTDAVLAGLARDAPGIPVLGGLSSGRSLGGSAALFLDETVHEEGAVGVCLDGVEMLPCVSQGAAPLGREMTITAADGNVILELAGKPAVQTIEEVIAELSIAERALVAAGLLIGIVIDAGKPDYEQGDFLVRGVLGADADTGAVAVGVNVRPGQVVRLHARDAGSADEDLRHALGLRARASGTQPPAGALVFSCNGRGQSMFGARDHDATVVDEVLGARPPPDSSPPARSARSAGAASCTPSPRRLPSSRSSLRAVPRRPGSPSPRPPSCSPAPLVGSARRSPARLRTRGARLLLTGRRRDLLEHLAGELGARALVADLAVAPDVDRLGAEAAAAGVDVLVANAATPASGDIGELTQATRSTGCSPSTSGLRSRSPTAWCR